MAAASGGPALRRTPWLAIAAGIVAFAILCGLGTWQVQRLAWKEGLVATIESRIHATPVRLAEALRSPEPVSAQEYRPVELQGTFVHAAERHFLATHQGKSGFYIYTPLRQPDGAYVFVNRGFVPYDRKDPATRPEGQVDGPVTVTGLLRAPLAEKPSAIVPDNDPARNVFYWKDIRAMAESAGLPADAEIVGVFVDANDAPNPGGLPVGGVTNVELPNNHLQYAVTWYGLAAALAGVGIAAWLRRRNSA